MEEEVPSYQVFINHRGPDTKKTLAALLYRDLTAEGVRVFLDENEIQTGDRNIDAIKGAIRSSYVHIAIFSRKYCESSWCLDELHWMLERTESTFIPIFHQVEPWELRRINKGTYGNAFIHHRENHGVEAQELEKWKKALEKASATKGEKFDPEAGPRNIVEITDTVVNRVLKEVWIKKPQEEVAEHAVGLKQAAEEFENERSKQYKGNGIITVGILGEGGSGKSTLAKHLYNMKRMEFGKSYLLSVASEVDCPSSQYRLLGCGGLPIEEDPASLQRRLQRCHHLRIEVPYNETSLHRLLENHLQGFPQVLVVLDELYNPEQIRSILSLKDKLGDKSMVVLTCRDKGLLIRSQVNVLYCIKPLDDTNARYLFCQHAFGLPIPLKGFEKFVQDVLRICEGLPLALKVLGEHFCGVTDQISWDKERRKLDRQLPDGIKKILNASYMSLDRAEKEVFLDVAHFLVGEDRDLVKRVLEGIDDSGFDYLSSLEQKCLVEFENPQSKDVYRDQSRSTKTCLKMKRLVRDLAREKAREEFESQPQVTPLRLSWADNRRISLPLDSPNVRGIRISSSSRKTVCTEISGLKYLVLENSTFPFRFWTGDLVWLRLHNLSGNQVLSGPSLEYLRVMELKGVPLANLSIPLDDEPPLKRREVTVDFQGISHQPAPSYSYTRRTFHVGRRCDQNPTGSSLLNGWHEGLKYLVKTVWKNVTDLEVLSLIFEALGRLTHLDLSGVSDLMALRSFTSLSNLQYLAVKDCSNLTSIELGGMSTIKCLHFERCGELKSLNVQGLKSIEEINAAGCWKLQRIEGFGQLQALSYFNISTASKLNSILPFPSNISTAILSVAASPTALDLVKDRMVETSPNATFYDLSTTAGQTSLKYTTLNRVIVVCFIGERRSDFQVRFGCDDGQIKSFDAKGSQGTLGSELYTGTPLMRIIMWTQDSEEWKDLKFRGREVISCTVQADNPLRGPEKGVIMMSKNKFDGVELLKRLC